MTTTEQPTTRQEATEQPIDRVVRGRLDRNQARLRRTEQQIGVAEMRVNALQLTRSGLLAAIQQDRESLA